MSDGKRAIELFRPLDQETRYLQYLRDVIVDAQVEQDVDNQLARVGLFPETQFDGTYFIPPGPRTAGYKSPPPPNSVSGDAP